MLLEAGWSAERAEADVAGEGGFDIVNPLHMIPQLVLASVGHLAQVTVEANLLVDRCDVPSEVWLRFEGRFASHALEFAFLVRFQMLVEKLFALEAGLTFGTAIQLSGGVDRPDVVPHLGAGEEGGRAVLAVEVGDSGVAG